jgi:acetylornithine/N-succinyldiaminopimelate aminotransferase
LALSHPVILEVRGCGLMRGLELSMDATPVVDEARERGLIVNRTAGTVVRMLPALTITAAEIDRAVDVLDGVLATVAKAVHA